MYILGIGCYYHDSSASLLKDGKIVAAAQEERFTRKKHDSSFPINAIKWCLESQGITVDDLEYVTFYEKPFLKFERLLSQHIEAFPRSLPVDVRAAEGFRALKLWCLLRAEGAEGLRTRLRRDLDNARWLADQVRSTPEWRLLAPVPLQTLCVRHEPPGLSGEALDRHTLAWADRVNRSGSAYLTPATLDGRWMVRVSIGAEPTERPHVEALWDTMRREAISTRSPDGPR